MTVEEVLGYWSLLGNTSAVPFTLAHRKGLTLVQVLVRRAQVLLYRYPSSRYHIRKFYSTVDHYHIGTSSKHVIPAAP